MTPQDPRQLPQVLYIAESDEARSLVRRLLSKKYIVLEAADPLDGLQLAEETNPDLVLVDSKLPHMTGNEVVTRVCKMFPHTPSVILSGETADDVRERALAAGAVGFIPKPIDHDFEKLIDEYLAGKIEKLEHAERYMQVYQQDLAEKFEGSIRQLTS